MAATRSILMAAHASVNMICDLCGLTALVCGWVDGWVAEGLRSNFSRTSNRCAAPIDRFDRHPAMASTIDCTHTLATSTTIDTHPHNTRERVSIGPCAVTGPHPTHGIRQRLPRTTRQLAQTINRALLVRVCVLVCVHLTLFAHERRSGAGNH